jgi:collagenase-like PrtC family protease
MEVSAMSGAFSISIGPVLYYWPRRTLTEFYAQVAESAARTVCLGELVCSRRHEMKVDDWFALARELSAAGKEVVLCAQALIETEAELRALRRFSENDEYLVEANDAAALAQLAGRPFVIGPHVNIYSAPALDEMVALGALRWVPPVELSLDAIAAVNPPRKASAIETEIFAFGRLPLAISARCFTARHHNRNRDDCGFRCVEHPDGLLVKTQEGEPFLALNGLQTQSARVHNLLGWRDALAESGVRRLRLSPTAQHFDLAIEAFDQVFNHDADAEASLAELAAAGLPGSSADGYARRRPGFEWSHA